MKIKNRVADICCNVIPVLFLGIMGFKYVHLSARNLVFMDFWKTCCLLIEPVMNHRISLDSFWHSGLGQRNPFQLMLLAFNIKYTNLNCLWESYAGIIIICLSATVFLIYWKIQNKDMKNKSRPIQLTQKIH